MARVAQRRGLSPSEYLAWEREQLGRHEYFHGEVFAMAGGSIRHNALCMRVGAALVERLGPRGCTVLSPNQRVGMGAGERYVYPDATVVCRRPVVVEEDVLTNPTILVEVLSESTEQYDRGLKWEGYQRLDSVTDYLLVSQREARIEHFRRGEGGTWSYAAATSGGAVMLSSGAVLQVDEVFAGVFELPGDG